MGEGTKKKEEKKEERREEGEKKKEGTPHRRPHNGEPNRGIPSSLERNKPANRSSRKYFHGVFKKCAQENAFLRKTIWKRTASAIFLLFSRNNDKKGCAVWTRTTVR